MDEPYRISPDHDLLQKTALSFRPDASGMAVCAVDPYALGSPCRCNDPGPNSRVRFTLYRSSGCAGPVCLEKILEGWRSLHGNVSRIPASGFYILRIGTIRLGSPAAVVFRLGTFRNHTCT